MKKISYLLTFIFIFASWGTNPKGSRTSIETNHPNKIFPLLNEFNAEAKDYGIMDFDSYLAQTLNRIEIVPEKSHLLKKKEGDLMIYDFTTNEAIGRLTHYKQESGLYNQYIYKTEIYMSEVLLDYPYALKHVLYHELGHMAGLTHNPEEFTANNKFFIMNELFPLWYIKKGYEVSDERWRQYKYILFSKIKGTEKENRWLKRHYGRAFN